MTSTREQFCAVLATGPMYKADLIVVCAGEDGEPRLQTGIQLFAQSGAPRIFITGGVHKPPRWIGAEALKEKAIELGIAPDRIATDFAADTREQARNTIALVKANGWKRLLLVASPYHAPRVFLTFLKALKDARVSDVAMLSVPAAQAPWFAEPDGMKEHRLQLLDAEFAKIDRYVAKGDVASYAEGLAYLRKWEGKVA